MASDDEYEIPESGAVFTFGRSRFAENVSSHFFIRNDPVEAISCGDEHTALVCKSGRVFLFGHNDYGQLGFGHTKIVNKPSCLKYLKPFHSTHVACGKGHTIISTACGRLFSFGCNSEGQLGVGDQNDRNVPQMIPIGLSEEDRIVTLSAGCHHSAFLTDKGDLYLWGSNSDGQCGSQDNENVMAPRKLDFEHPISYVSCGYYHTAFISQGITYTFGEEDNGKLGRSNNSLKGVPGKVDVDENCIVVKCGGSHTMILTSSGRVYAFGSNFSGQLGIDSNDAECSSPVQIHLSGDVKCLGISCGESHSAFVTENGYLYTCGDARYGKLCNEDESTNYSAPILIGSFQSYFCTSVSCGGCHTMVLAKTRSFGNDTGNRDNKTTLPPLKTNKEGSNFIIKNGDKEEENIEIEKYEGNKQLKLEENEEFDNKSSTESNLNNEEITTQVDEIYSDIQEMEQDKNNEPKSIQLNTSDDHKESNENEVVVENTFQKLVNVFTRKKSSSAILTSEPLENKSEGKTGNQHKSKTCHIL